MAASGEVNGGGTTRLSTTIIDWEASRNVSFGEHHQRETSLRRLVSGEVRVGDGMAMDINVNVRAIEKLVDYTASGIGSTASFFFSRMAARRDADARLVSAESEARAQRILAESQASTMGIIAKAQAEARSTLISPEAVVEGEVDFGVLVDHRVKFQEQKRQANIGSVVHQAALELGEEEVQDHQVDHDWTARFFSDVQDVSSEQMQALWAKILAGEVTRPGSTSIRTLSILRSLDRDVASLFARLCHISISVRYDEQQIVDARVPILGNFNEGNALSEYGINYPRLNLLNEHGLIVSDYNSWGNYNMCITACSDQGGEGMQVLPFKFQGRYWVLRPLEERNAEQEFRLNGVALSAAGRELAMVVELGPEGTFARDLRQFFRARQLHMLEVDNGLPRSADPRLWE